VVPGLLRLLFSAACNRPHCRDTLSCTAIHPASALGPSPLNTLVN
jgi:hypothetical protein